MTNTFVLHVNGKAATFVMFVVPGAERAPGTD